MASCTADRATDMVDHTPPPFPAFEPPTEPEVRADGVAYRRAQTYAIDPGYRPLRLDVWVPRSAAPPPLVVWIHGGAWMMGDRRQIIPTIPLDSQFEALLAAGLAVATIDYRLAFEAAFPAQLHDAKAAIRWLRQHADELGFDAECIGIWGESAGAHLGNLVALTANRPDLEGDLGVVGPSSEVQAVVSWYGPSDVETMPGFPAEVMVQLPVKMRVDPTEAVTHGDSSLRPLLSPINHVHADAPPFFLQHGTADILVPHTQSEALAATLEHLGVSADVELVEGADHIFMGSDDLPGIVDRAVAFLAEHLGADKK